MVDDVYLISFLGEVLNLILITMMYSIHAIIVIIEEKQSNQ